MGRDWVQTIFFSNSRQIKLHKVYILKSLLLLTVSSHCIVSIMKDSSNEFTRQASGWGSSESMDRIRHEEGSTESIDSEDDDMKSFYTSLGADSQSASNSVITNVQSKKTRPGQFNIDKALDMIKNVLATDFSSACHPGCSIS